MFSFMSMTSSSLGPPFKMLTLSYQLLGLTLMSKIWATYTIFWALRPTVHKMGNFYVKRGIFFLYLRGPTCSMPNQSVRLCLQPISSRYLKAIQSLMSLNTATPLGLSCQRYILDILAQCNRPKPNPACTSSLGFSHLYILMLWLIVTQVIVVQVIVLHSYI